MRINENYSIEKLDERNFVIQMHKQWGKDSKRAGEEYTETFGYYGTLEAACKRILNLGVETNDVKTILSTIKQAKKEIIGAINAQ